MKHKKLIDHAKRSLIEGRPDDALMAVKQISENPSMLAESKHDETKSALSHLVELAEAGRRGVIAAREKISGAMHDSTNLPTYNQNGAMEVSNLSIKKPMRF